MYIKYNVRILSMSSLGWIWHQGYGLCVRIWLRMSLKFDRTNGVAIICAEAHSIAVCVCVCICVLRMCLGVCIFWSYKTPRLGGSNKFSVGTRRQRIPIWYIYYIYYVLCVFGSSLGNIKMPRCEWGVMLLQSRLICQKRCK